jgi:amidase
VIQVFLKAVEDLRSAGATIVDPANVEGLDEIRRPRESGASPGPCMGFKYDINHFLAARADHVPVKDLAAIIQSRGFHPSVQRRLEEAEKGGETSPARRHAWPRIATANDSARRY